MRVETDRITVLFEEAGYRTLSLEAIQRDDNLLTLHPDAARANSRPPGRRGRGGRRTLRTRRDKAAAGHTNTTTDVS
jgi:ATP-dependent DNA helicase RecQ